jgi:hypothetical protein
MSTVFVIAASEEIHHVIVDYSGVSIDVAKGVIIEKVGYSLRPALSLNVVAVYHTLLANMILAFLTRQASIDIDG